MYSTPRATSYASIHGANANAGRNLPKSPVPAPSMSTAPTVYSFARQAPMLPDSPPAGNNASHQLLSSTIGPYSLPQLMSASPPRHASPSASNNNNYNSYMSSQHVV